MTYKFIVTVIEAATHTMQLQTIMEAESQGHVLSILNAEYPQFHVYETSNTQRFRIYITVIN